jgi:hypothetical protein
MPFPHSSRVALVLLVALAGCAEVAESSSFARKRPDSYNQKIRLGRSQQQAWTATPWRIMQHLLGPESNEESYPFDFQQVIQADSSRIVTVTQEHLPDDAVYGERTIWTFVRDESGWVVKAIKVGYQCQPGRGHSDSYSGTKCN